MSWQVAGKVSGPVKRIAPRIRLLDISQQILLQYPTAEGSQALEF